MKKINYLAAMALPVMFAACSNEELAAVQEESQQKQEFVGAELIANGISANFGTGSDSRLVGTTWEDTDKLGLGWVVTESYINQQDETNAPNKNEMYANHLFYRGENGGFETKANIYKGWHFAYYPFTYMSELGKAKTVTINPVQTQEFVKDRYNTCLYLSAREFLSREDLNDDYQLEEVNFLLARAFNTIGVTVKPNEVLKTKDVLKVMPIKSLTINAGGKKIFYTGTAELNPHNLPTFQYDKDGKYASMATEKALYDSFKSVVNCKNNVDNVTVEVKNDQINLSGDQTVRVYVKPLTAVIKKTDISFVVAVDGGEFTIAYTNKPAEELSEAEANNNLAIEQLVEAYASKGTMSAYGINNGVMGLNLDLTESMLQPTTDAIDSEEKWNHVVNIVNALGMNDVTFNIVAGAEGEPWAFEDIDGDGNLINLPSKANVTVTAADGVKMILGAEGTWPAERFTVDTDVEVNANLTVADGVTMTANSIVNNATITAGYKSTIANVNNQKEIKVVYGTFIKDITEYGIISYEVPAATATLTEATIQKRISYLIDRKDNDNFVYVNKLYVGEGVKLNLSTTTKEGTQGTESDNDPYRPSPGQGASGAEYDLIPGLENVSLEINGGTVTSTNTASLVKAVVNGGTLRNVTLANGLTATDATVEATSIVGGVEATNSTVTAETIEGGLKTTKSTIEVTSSIKGGVKATESTITAETIEGGLTATDATITAEAITVESNGTVVLKGATTINNAEITGNVTVENGTTSLNNVNINGDMIIKAGAKVVIAGKDTKITNIDNYGELTTSVNVYTETVEIFKGSKANVAEDKTIWYNTPSYGEYGYTQEGNTNGSILYRNLKFVNNNKELDEALKNTEVSAIVLGNGEYTIDLYSDAHSKTSLSIFGVEGTKVKFANQQVRLGIFDKFTIQNCEILKMETKVWGMLVFASGKENGVYTVSNCTFNGVETQGIYINESSSNVVYNIKGCTFNGKFGNEGPITIQENNVAVNIKINDCSFTNRGDESVRNICILDHSANDNTILDTDVEDSQVSKVRRY